MTAQDRKKDGVAGKAWLLSCFFQLRFSLLVSVEKSLLLVSRAVKEARVYSFGR
jgi:hypothetical protein